ncbi:serine hydrolase domain-containing protein [Paenibacillus sp. 481]|uniref:serine hydrolase domain-containing protein n=1 Tax=Paenibacillus sp. 481 TaxID=2835869 RepID=UPI001E4CC1A3|nr:serine hydrolase domain-containing protein [Paenibacillus sp. 481]UHA74340.1 beta-lactamase family protein [Paenibacillus sp. 481]
MDLNVVERMRHHHVSGVSIALIRNGVISMTQGFGVLDNESPTHTATNMIDHHTIFNACSISKFLTSVLVLTLVDQGILDLDEDVNRRLVSWKVPHNEFTHSKKVTLRNLLSHQSGIMDPVGSFRVLDDSEGIPTMAMLLGGNTSYCKELIEVKYVPESDFQYSDAGFCVIQLVIEDVCNQPFIQVMDELVFRPLNMSNSTYIQAASEVINKPFCCGHDKNGQGVNDKYAINPYPAAAGLWTTPTDLATLVIEMMNSLTDNRHSRLPNRLIKQLLIPQGCKEWAGLGLFLDGSEHEIEVSSLGWGVGFQCMMVAYPYLGTGAVIMTNTDLGIHQLKGIIGEIFNCLNLKSPYDFSSK